MSSARSAILKRVALDLVPKAKDTRKFRLSKPMVFKPAEAMALAAAFRHVKTLSQNPKLTMKDFLVALASGVSGAEVGNVDPKDIQETLDELFTVKEGAVPTVLA